MRPPALDPLQVEPTRGSNYPDPFRQRVAARAKRKLGEALGLKNFGVNLTMLGPGAQSALRHWHARQDEFVYVLSGELVRAVGIYGMQDISLRKKDWALLLRGGFAFFVWIASFFPQSIRWRGQEFRVREKRLIPVTRPQP